MDKRKKLIELGTQRKKKRVCSGYKQIGKFNGVDLDYELVSPYSRTAGNENADVFVMLQDWCSEEWLRKRSREELEKLSELGYWPCLPTNRNLIKLLKCTWEFELNDVFGTNLFPFIKHGKMQGPVRTEHLKRAAETFGRPQIEIVEPKLVVCLGLDTFNAVGGAFGQRRRGTFKEAFDAPFETKGSRVWCQAHPGNRGVNNRGGFDKVREDWEQMKKHYQRQS